jgi:antitoxin component YwqK of YwqJK toxin-antitoxin module
MAKAGIHPGTFFCVSLFLFPLGIAAGCNGDAADGVLEKAPDDASPGTQGSEDDAGKTNGKPADLDRHVVRWAPERPLPRPLWTTTRQFEIRLEGPVRANLSQVQGEGQVSPFSEEGDGLSSVVSADGKSRLRLDVRPRQPGVYAVAVTSLNWNGQVPRIARVEQIPLDLGEVHVFELTFDAGAQVGTATVDFCGAPGLSDRDHDGICNHLDNCVDRPNSDQADRDGDGRGDVCDPKPEPQEDEGGGIADEIFPANLVGLFGLPKCKDGTQRMGAPPPKGEETGCARTNGIRHGRWVVQENEGLWESTGEYREDRREGHWVTRDAKNPNRLVREGAYARGKKTGLWRYYRADGIRVRAIEKYHQGKNTRPRTEGCLSGAQATGLAPPRGAQLTCEDAAGRFHGADRAWWDENGTRRHEHGYRLGQRHGRWVEYGPDGKKLEEKHFRKGTPHGRHRKWDENGKVIHDASFVRGKIDGLVKTFNEAGFRTRETTWRLGLKHGPFRAWHDNKEPHYTGAYKNGRATGTWQEWCEHGILNAHGTYRGGRLQSGSPILLLMRTKEGETAPTTRCMHAAIRKTDGGAP